jgi:hypothetical protein
MVPSRAWQLALVGALIAGVAGCGYLPGGPSAELEDDEFGDLDAAPSDDPLDELQEPAAARSGDLALKLEVGQRFPLYKTVEQRLTQMLPTGKTVGHSRLDLQLSLVVEEVRDSRRRLSVRYHRVRFSQDLGGHTVEYNSDQPLSTVPAEALPYAGLKDNGFAFWLGADNQVIELVGFMEFLQRCVQQVPFDQRPAVLTQLRAMRPEDGLANFVDDSIGLLPNPASPQQRGEPLRVGSSWDLPSRSASAGGFSSVPATTTTRCLLKDLTESTAEIALVGSIGPSSYADDLRQVKLSVRGGQCSGSCLVDRATGMPTRSRVERTLEMTALLPDGTEIPQRKEVVTTITAFLDQGTMRPAAGLEAGSGVRQSAYSPDRPTRDADIDRIALPSATSSGRRLTR